MTIHSDILQEAYKAGPPATVATLTLAGVALQDWVLLATLGYTILQLYFLLRDKWWRQRKGKNGRK